MAEVTFRIPSKKVQYGYVEIKGEPEELGLTGTGDAHALAQAYIDYVTAFARSEVGAVTAASKQEEPPKDPENSAEVEKLLHDELGAVKIGTKKNAKPWESADFITANTKPWEQQASAPAVDWDI